MDYGRDVRLGPRGLYTSRMGVLMSPVLQEILSRLRLKFYFGTLQREDSSIRDVALSLIELTHYVAELEKKLTKEGSHE